MKKEEALERIADALEALVKQKQAAATPASGGTGNGPPGGG